MASSGRDARPDARILGIALAAAPRGAASTSRCASLPRRAGAAPVECRERARAAPRRRRRAQGRHDLKHSEVLLARHGLQLDGHDLRPMLAAYLLDPEAPHALEGPRAREFGTELPDFDEGTTEAGATSYSTRSTSSARRRSPAPQAELALCARRAPRPARRAGGARRALDERRAAALARPRGDGARRASSSTRRSSPTSRRRSRPSCQELEEKAQRARRARLRAPLPRPARGDPLRRAQAPGRQAHAEDRPLDRRRRCSRSSPTSTRCPRSSSSTASSPSSRAPTSTRCRALVNPGDRAHPHALRPGRRGDGAPLVARPEPAEHPDPHRARAARSARAFVAPPGVLHRQRRLLADRAARARAPLGGPGARRRVPRRARTCTRAPRRAVFDVPARRGDRARCAAAPRRSTSASSTAWASRARAASSASRAHEAAALHRRVLRALRGRARASWSETIDDGAARRGRAHDPRSPALLAESPLVESRRCARGRAHRAEHADPGHRRRHPQARDGRAAAKPTSCPARA